MNYDPRGGAGTHSPLTATVVLVGFIEQDQDFLRKLFDCAECPLAANCRWTIQPRASVAATLMALRRDPVQVVLCDRDFVPEAWKELLAQFACLSEPPCLIVTSRLADERLWAEALNLGAYDVLARPFDRTEVVRSVSLARLHWQDRCSPNAAVARSVAVA
jgi:DNA-binding response OmpR family regulator